MDSHWLVTFAGISGDYDTVLGKSEDAVGTWGGFSPIQVVILMVSIFPTEVLAKKF
ncbi:MAG: hypothetical protein ACLT46_07305 [Hungatella sp.]